jgi:class 3 adenylate cyclase
MNEATPSLKQLNRTFIGSVLFIDIVGYSLRTVPDQLEMKELFNNLLAEAVHNIAPSERIMVDTGDGAGIAFLGDPEDALFAALSLRDAISEGRATVGDPGFVRMGINLGPLKVVRDINGHTNMIGDGVNDAERVMSFAEAGQVMVSHSYYDIISRFSRDYAQLFVYEGTRHDKHVREHEIYRFEPVEGNQNLAEKLRDRSRARHMIETAAPVPAATWKRLASNAGDAARRSIAVSRTAMVAVAVGSISIVGAVWSWTATPEMHGSTKPSMIAVALPAVPVPVSALPGLPEQKPDAGMPDLPVAQKTRSDAPVPASAADVPALEKATEKNETNTPLPPVAKPGKVRLAVQPWGEVYVNGSKRGISPPLKTVELAPGKHRIEIRNGEFAPHKETVEVKSGAETTVHYVF